jgi:hypothetical protein
MPFGARRGYSENMTPRQIENLRAAAAFADEIGHPLTLSIDINWTRTSLWDDRDGRVLDKLMELNRKWLKGHGVTVFAQIEVRECPEQVYSNAHLLLHCPQPLMPAFKIQFRQAFKRLCGPRVEAEAIKFVPVGGGNPTLKAALGKIAYLTKGAAPDTAKRFGITPKPQGRIYGKPVGVSQDINRAARQRHAAAKEQRWREGLQGLAGATMHLLPPLAASPQRPNPGHDRPQKRASWKVAGGTGVPGVAPALCR